MHHLCVFFYEPVSRPCMRQCQKAVEIKHRLNEIMDLCLLFRCGCMELLLEHVRGWKVFNISTSIILQLIRLYENLIKHHMFSWIFYYHNTITHWKISNKCTFLVTHHCWSTKDLGAKKGEDTIQQQAHLKNRTCERVQLQELRTSNYKKKINNII